MCFTRAWCFVRPRRPHCLGHYPRPTTRGVGCPSLHRLHSCKTSATLCANGANRLNLHTTTTCALHRGTLHLNLHLHRHLHRHSVHSLGRKRTKRRSSPSTRSIARPCTYSRAQVDDGYCGAPTQSAYPYSPIAGMKQARTRYLCNPVYETKFE